MRCRRSGKSDELKKARPGGTRARARTAMREKVAEERMEGREVEGLMEAISDEAWRKLEGRSSESEFGR